jgi:hypothetical protein
MLMFPAHKDVIIRLVKDKARCFGIIGLSSLSGV